MVNTFFPIKRNLPKFIEYPMLIGILLLHAIILFHPTILLSFRSIKTELII